MTDAAPDPRAETTRFVQTWAECLAQVLGQIAGSPLPCTLLAEAPAELPAASETDLWIVGACSGGLRGELSLRLPPVTVLRLAQIFQSEPAAPETAVTAEHREATTELLRQVAGLVASVLKPVWGEVPLRLEHALASPSWPSSSTFWLGIGAPPAGATLEVNLSAALAASLRPEKADAATGTLTTSPKAADSKVQLDLLMDVELAVTLRFGSRRLLLREVLDLSPGAVVNLDRQVQEPVDVLLDGRLVARGEVVVIDGNYGLRVTEIGPAS